MNVPATVLYAPPPRFLLAGEFATDDLRVPNLYRRRGIGDEATAIVGSVGASLIKGAAATGPAAPYVAAVGAVMELGAAIGNLFQGCGSTCIQSTQFANSFEAAVLQLKNYYFAQPIHYQSIQTATLQQMQAAANSLQQACSDPSLGAAGQRCISERLVRGGTAPWCPNPGHTGCDFWSTFYDPIANDPNVVPDPSTASTSDVGLVSSSGTMNWGWSHW